MLDCCLWAPHGVEHYKIAAIYAKYEQNPMITAYIDTKSIYTSILDLHLFRNKKEVWVDQDLPIVVGYNCIGFVMLPHQNYVDDNVDIIDTYRTQMVMIEMSSACRRYTSYRFSK